MTLSEELTWRGFINQTTITDLSTLDDRQWTFYHGFDASADSQTIGNLASMMLDRCFLRHGHKAILLAGGATSLIGDPGGKDKERPMQSAETIAHNMSVAGEQLQRVFKGYDFTLVNNHDWYKDMSVLAFLRDVGKHFSMTPLVQRDYIAKRLGEGGAGISFTEFSYTLLQGYDFQHLYENYGVTLQLSGSDQWGNCLSGVDLLRRVHNVEAHALTQPLVINQATGRKFGKTEEGAVWLDPAKTTPTKFYQFWVNSDDAGLESYLKVYTELDKPTIDAILAEHQANPGARSGQLRLAAAVTTLVHGEQATETAQKVTAILTGKIALGDADEATMQALRQEIPAVKAADTISETLIAAGLAASSSEARRLFAGNAISLNGQKVTTDAFEADAFVGGRALLRKGKKFSDTALVEQA